MTPSCKIGQFHTDHTTVWPKNIIRNSLLANRYFFKTVDEKFSQCKIVLFCKMVSNCPKCQIVRGVKLSSLHGRCQIVLGVKLSVVSNCPTTHYYHQFSSFIISGLTSTPKVMFPDFDLVWKFSRIPFMTTSRSKTNTIDWRGQHTPF